MTRIKHINKYHAYIYSTTVAAEQVDWCAWDQVRGVSEYLATWCVAAPAVSGTPVVASWDEGVGGKKPLKGGEETFEVFTHSSLV